MLYTRVGTASCPGTSGSDFSKLQMGWSCARPYRACYGQDFQDHMCRDFTLKSSCPNRFQLSIAAVFESVLSPHLKSVQCMGHLYIAHRGFPRCLGTYVVYRVHFSGIIFSIPHLSCFCGLFMSYFTPLISLLGPWKRTVITSGWIRGAITCHVIAP